jgi:hypothetical protein
MAWRRERSHQDVSKVLLRANIKEIETNLGMSEGKIDTQALTVRSTNNPVSDCAELLFCKAFGWMRTEDAASGYDAIDQQGTRYLIKPRRITPTDPKRLALERRAGDHAMTNDNISSSRFQLDGAAKTGQPRDDADERGEVFGAR